MYYYNYYDYIVTTILQYLKSFYFWADVHIMSCNFQ